MVRKQYDITFAERMQAGGAVRHIIYLAIQIGRCDMIFDLVDKFLKSKPKLSTYRNGTIPDRPIERSGEGP